MLVFLRPVLLGLSYALSLLLHYAGQLVMALLLVHIVSLAWLPELSPDHLFVFDRNRLNTYYIFLSIK